MRDLLRTSTPEQIASIKATYRDNADIMKMVSDYEAELASEAKAKEVKEAFIKGIEATFNNAKHPLPHPEDIANIYIRWAEVDQPNGEAVDVEVVQINPANGQPVAGENGKPVMVKEMRTPTIKVWMWVVELNKGFNVVKSTAAGGGNATATTTTKKRAITVEAREGNAIKAIGNFTTGKAACTHLKVDAGVGSANLALRNAGYIVTSYDGNTFIS